MSVPGIKHPGKKNASVREKGFIQLTIRSYSSSSCGNQGRDLASHIYNQEQKENQCIHAHSSAHIFLLFKVKNLNSRTGDVHNAGSSHIIGQHNQDTPTLHIHTETSFQLILNYTSMTIQINHHKVLSNEEWKDNS